MRASESLGLGLVVIIASGIGAGLAVSYWPHGHGHHATPGPTDAVVFVDDDCSVKQPIKNAVNFGFSKQTFTWKIKSKCGDFNTAGAEVLIEFSGTPPPLDPADSCSGGCKGKLNPAGVLNLPIKFADYAGGTYTYTIKIAGTPLADPMLEIDP